MHLNTRRELVTPLPTSTDLSPEPFILYLARSQRTHDKGGKKRSSPQLLIHVFRAIFDLGKTEEEQLVDALSPLDAW
jgi:hypothetical protein